MINDYHVDDDWQLDPLIKPFVKILIDNGIETFESCQGGEDHCFPVPTIRFLGHREEGPRAVAVCLANYLPISNIRRTWSIEGGEMVGPYWELTFLPFKEG